MASFFSIEPEMIRVPEHLFEQESGFIETGMIDFSCPGQRFH